jgi:hypothetical protein
MALNVIQQLGPVPVQTPVLANNGNFTWGWINYFQAIFNAVKTIPQPNTAVPVNPSVIAGYQASVNQAGETIFIPYYQ